MYTVHQVDLYHVSQLYRDYYIWRPGKTDTSGRRIPPNNWRSIWGNGSAWEYDETTDE